MKTQRLELMETEGGVGKTQRGQKGKISKARSEKRSSSIANMNNLKKNTR